MKSLFSLLSMLVTTFYVFGQAQEGTVELQKSQQPAAVIEIPYSPSIVTAALNDYLSKKGKSKGTDLKGFTTYRNTTPVPSDSVNADLYFKVERKNRKEKESSIVSLLLTMPKEGGASPDNLRYMNMEQAKTCLNDLVPAIEAFNLEQEIKDQNEAVIKAESKYKNLVEEGADLEKKRVSIEKKIQENRQDQQAQMKEVENQKQKLTVWVNQRKF